MQLTLSKHNNQKLFLSKPPGKSLGIHRKTKLTVLIVLGLGFMLYRIFNQIPYKKACVVDELHELTFGINRWINGCCSHAILGIAQVVMDVLVVVSSILWILFIKNYRFPLTVASFYYCRTMLMRFTTMPYTSYVIWESPGFPTLTVPYDHTSDYFFSGHTGAVMIFLLEMKKLKTPLWVHLIGYAAVIFMMFTLITVRVHYSIDVYAAVFYAAEMHSIVSSNLPIGDQIMCVPYECFRLIFVKLRDCCCRSKERDEGTSLYDFEKV